MAINLEKVSNILQNFVSGTNDVQGAALVTPDGLPLSSTLPGGMDEERVSAMSAAMLSLGERIGTELTRGEIDRIYVEGDTGYGILTNCGDDAVFLVLANQAAKQGLLMLEIKHAVSDLKALLL
ncbi:roadblock/LC7 domain-containing protein [Oscillatoria sp. CS-180]|uniref:roadblock/LC7 domain-containing protein n=1 Tax=Oscillatoria sp. CS-180 TaxID=3021720 RepID=UPI0023303336|nr:roadblock/LC7 domain-containing protein [Oscillatoria sp. CS-180]MDB9524921.1 roadblock/LC7 domain-containing protein [Oscillatoria sp. CS-180]